MRHTRGCASIFGNVRKRFSSRIIRHYMNSCIYHADALKNKKISVFNSNISPIS